MDVTSYDEQEQSELQCAHTGPRGPSKVILPIIRESAAGERVSVLGDDSMGPFAAMINSTSVRFPPVSTYNRSEGQRPRIPGP